MEARIIGVATVPPGISIPHCYLKYDSPTHQGANNIVNIVGSEPLARALSLSNNLQTCVTPFSKGEIWYGSSSNVSLGRQIGEIANPSSAACPLLGSDNVEQDCLLGALDFPSIMVSTPAPEFNSIVLPERQITNRLLGHYWEFVHPIFPLVHQTTFTGKFWQLWESVDSSATTKNGCDMEHIVFHAISTAPLFKKKRREMLHINSTNDR